MTCWKITHAKAFFPRYLQKQSDNEPALRSIFWRPRYTEVHSEPSRALATTVTSSEAGSHYKSRWPLWVPHMLIPFQRLNYTLAAVRIQTPAIISLWDNFRWGNHFRLRIAAQRLHISCVSERLQLPWPGWLRTFTYTQIYILNAMQMLDFYSMI